MKIIKSTLIIVLLASGSVYAKDTNMELRRIPALTARNPGGEVIVTVDPAREKPLSSSCRTRPGGCYVLAQ